MAVAARMRRIGVALLGVTLILTLDACIFRHRYDVGDGARGGDVVHDRWHNYWLGGLVGRTAIDIEELCPSGDATIRNRQSFLNLLVGALTAEIYTPTTVKVRCRDGRRAELAVDEEGIRRIVADPLFLEWVEETMPERLEEAADARELLDR